MMNRLFSSIIIGIILLAFTNLTQAADVSVSATIPDIVPPSAPILIYPEDESLINNNKPSFKWYEATDNVAVSHYALYVDGNLLFDNIPLGSVENSGYKLQYDAINGTYSLTVKTALSDANHSWRVMVYDYGGNSNTSDTWEFRIDTLAPFFTIKQIGDVLVNISTSNLSSIPSSPILLFSNDPNANEPVILAIGEAYSSVQLTVTIPSDPTQNFTRTIASDGSYSLQLGILPRNVDIRLDFLITDQVGHVSVLEDIYIRIALQYWPPTTITSVPTAPQTITPTTILSGSPTQPVTGTLTPTITPTPEVSPTAEPTGIIPIFPPKEVVHEVTQEITELLPDSISQMLEKWFASSLWQDLSKAIGLYLLLIFYLLVFILLVSKFFADLGKNLLQQIAYLIWPWQPQHRPHLVFEYSQTIVSPLVKVELFIGQVSQGFHLSDLKGNFADFDWPRSGDFHLKAIDNNFYFPIGVDKPAGMDAQLFYQQEALNLESYRSHWPLIIPTLRAKGQTHLPIIEQVRLFALYLSSYPWWFLSLSFVVSLLFSLRFGGIANYVATVFYLTVLASRFLVLYRNRFKRTVAVVDKDGREIVANLICSLQGEQISDSQAWLFQAENGRLILPIGLPLALLVAFSRHYSIQEADLRLVSGKTPTLLLTKRD